MIAARPTTTISVRIASGGRRRRNLATPPAVAPIAIRVTTFQLTDSRETSRKLTAAITFTAAVSRFFRPVIDWTRSEVRTLITPAIRTPSSLVFMLTGGEGGDLGRLVTAADAYS